MSCHDNVFRVGLTIKEISKGRGVRHLPGRGPTEVRRHVVYFLLQDGRSRVVAVREQTDLERCKSEALVYNMRPAKLRATSFLHTQVHM
jgi:hypothetical protein